jgi:hypothetical protein
VATEYRGSASYICNYNLNYKNTYMYHLKCYHPTQEPLPPCTYSIHRLCSRWGKYSVNHEEMIEVSGGKVGGCVGYMYIGSAADGVLGVLTIRRMIADSYRVIQQG